MQFNILHILCNEYLPAVTYLRLSLAVTVRRF